MPFIVPSLFLPVQPFQEFYSIAERIVYIKPDRSLQRLIVNRLNSALLQMLSQRKHVLNT